MLPFFFRHYDSLVDRYFIYDDGSSDGTEAMLRSHPRVVVRRFPRSHGRSFALSEQRFSDACWKESRGEADWVIVTDLDEHLVHAGGRDYLARCAAAGVTMIPALGFQMISDQVPAQGEHLASSYRMGAPWIQMMKASIFAPDAIAEINFAAGRHRAEPTGRVVVPRTDELLLLHYKYLGFARTLERHRTLSRGLGELDLERGWGHKYGWSEAELREDWEATKRNAVDWRAATRDTGWRYPIVPWWERYRSR